MRKVVAILIGMFLITNLQAQDLVDWRGPDRTGVYNETGLLKTWPDGGPDTLWTIQNLPKGYSSVSVYDGMIYFTGIENNKDLLIASDMNGKIVWQLPYGDAWTKSYSDSRCTPTIENNKVYVSSGMGEVVCIDAKSGKIIWSQKASEEFGSSYGSWGISENLLLVDDKIIFTPAGEQTTVVAYNKNNGELIWKSESLNDIPAYVSPILVERGGKKIIINVTEKNAFGINAKNGDMLWVYDYGSHSNDKGWNIQCVTPVYDDGKIFITSGYNHNCIMLNLAKNGKSVKLAWESEVLDTHHGGVVKVGDYIYGANWDSNRMGNWICMDWETGDVLYDTNWQNKGSIISAEGMLYCYEEKRGNIALVKATPEKFDIVSEFQITMGKGPHWSHPVIKDGVLYMRHEDVLMAFDIKE